MSARSSIIPIPTREEGGIHPNPIGRLYYVVCVADDVLHEALAFARARQTGLGCTVFAHRYTMGFAENGDVALSDAEFELRRRRGLLVMDWESDGVCYGIGTEVNYWQAKGLSVVVGGSCHHLARAFARYPDMAVIWIGASSTKNASRSPSSCTTAVQRAGGNVIRVSRCAHAGEALLAALVDEEIQRQWRDRV